MIPTRLKQTLSASAALLILAPTIAIAQESDAAAKAREARRAARERIRQAQQQQQTGQPTAGQPATGAPAPTPVTPPATTAPPSVPAPLGEAALPRVALEIGTANEFWGRVVIELDPKKAPGTVRNFLQYVDAHFYDGVIFHRVLPGFVVQTGGYSAIEQRKEATRPPISNEARTAGKNVRATVAMARSKQPHTATTQFFFNMKDNPGLDADCAEGDGWGYAVFGRVVEGFSVIERIQSVATRANPAIPSENSVPLAPPMIKRTTKLNGGDTATPPAANNSNNSTPTRPRGRVRPGQVSPPAPGLPPQNVPGQPPVGQPPVEHPPVEHPPVEQPQPVIPPPPPPPEPVQEPIPEQIPPDIEQHQEEQGQEPPPPPMPVPQPVPPS